MKIGNYDIFAIETGYFALDGGGMFGVIPKNLWQRLNPPDDQNRIQLALRCLLLKSLDKLILVDTGIGHNNNKKFRNMFKINHNMVTMANSFNQIGLTFVEVTDVILSHLHFDHTGGTTIIANGELKLTFPNACHHVQVEHWNWACNPSFKDRDSFLTKNFTLLNDTNNLNLLNGNIELFPGIEILTSYGHTPAMQLVKVSDGHDTLLFCADLIPTATHIPLPWVMAYDNNPITTIEEKKELLLKSVEENWLLFFGHDPFRPAARVGINDRGAYEMTTEVHF